MTLKAIKAMFVVGQLWAIRRIDHKGLKIVGNTQTTTIPPSETKESRTVQEVRSKDLVWNRGDGKTVYTAWPKASEVIEASADYLRFRYSEEQGGVEVEMRKLLT